MRLPTRKPGKYAGQKNDPHITRGKYQELEAGLDKLKRFSRPKAIAEVKRLALDGDFSENAAYSIAKGRLRGINRRILDIENRLKQAEIIHKRGADKVELGVRVKIRVNGREKTYEILGSTETDPDRGVISHNSPLGRALMGRREGDEFKVVINGQEKMVKILKIK